MKEDKISYTLFKSCVRHPMSELVTKGKSLSDLTKEWNRGAPLDCCPKRSRVVHSIKYNLLVQPRGDSGEKKNESVQAVDQAVHGPRSKHKLGYNVTWKDEFLCPPTLKKVTLRAVLQVCCVLFVSAMALNKEIVLARGPGLKNHAPICRKTCYSQTHTDTLREQ